MPSLHDWLIGAHVTQPKKSTQILPSFLQSVVSPNLPPPKHSFATSPSQMNCPWLHAKTSMLESPFFPPVPSTISASPEHALGMADANRASRPSPAIEYRDSAIALILRAHAVGSDAD